MKLSLDGKRLLQVTDSEIDSDSPFIVPDSVTTIEAYAFESCTGLTQLIIPDSLTTIGESAFYGCTGLTQLIIPNSVTTIGESAFYGCTGLTQLIIPDSVTTIVKFAFDGCTGLTQLRIPSSVTAIESFTFNNCTGLIQLSIPSSVTTIEAYAFDGCTGLTQLRIPSSVTTIEASAFTRCTSLTQLIIPDSVTTIGDTPFLLCHKLKNIIIKGDAERMKKVLPKELHQYIVSKERYEKAVEIVNPQLKTLYRLLMQQNPIFRHLVDVIRLPEVLAIIIDSYRVYYEHADSAEQSMLAAILDSADEESYLTKLDDICNKALKASGCSTDPKQINPPNPSGLFTPKKSGCSIVELPDEPSLKSSDKEKSGMRM